MPSNAFGLLLFLAATVPGFVFTARRESRFPSRSRSAFRETASIAVASLCCLVVSAGLYAALRWWHPEWTIDLGAFVRNGSAYVRENYARVAVSGAVVLGVAVVIAAIAAAVLPGPRGEILYVSAWYKYLRQDATDRSTYLHALCELQDGTTLSGSVLDLNGGGEETADRDLVLEGPIQIARSGRPAQPFENVNRVLVSASQIRYIAITELPWPAESGQAEVSAAPAPTGDGGTKGPRSLRRSPKPPPGR